LSASDGIRLKQRPKNASGAIISTALGEWIIHTQHVATHQQVQIDMSAPGERESTKWQYSEDLDEGESGNEDDDGHYNRNPTTRIQGITRGRIADPPTTTNKGGSRPDSGADAVAAFQKYNLQTETSEILMIEPADIRIPAEHKSRLSNPFVSDARVRAYFHGVFNDIDEEAIKAGRRGGHEQQAPGGPGTVIQAVGGSAGSTSCKI
jgi:hypothetical protein